MAPETYPDWIYAESMLVHLPAIPGIVLRDIVFVAFVPSATQAQRQAAIDLIEGEVVGGDRAGGAAGGIYLVRIEKDASGRRLLAAVHSLRRLPQVSGAWFDVAEDEQSGKAH